MFVNNVLCTKKKGCPNLSENFATAAEISRCQPHVVACYAPPLVGPTGANNKPPFTPSLKYEGCIEKWLLFG